MVHIEHGVGRYQGLITLEAGGIKAEYLILTYAGDDKLYVPVSSLHLISRYAGGADENAPLHKLGSDSWGRARQKAAEKYAMLLLNCLIFMHNEPLRLALHSSMINNNTKNFVKAFHSKRRLTKKSPSMLFSVICANH